MKEKYYPPKYQSMQFHCIYCGVFAHQRWFTTWIIEGLSTQTGILVSECSHCGKWSYWFNEKMVVPAASPIEPPHPDLPDDCKKDYIEAQSVFVQSPRSSAALLRLCIQKLMPYLGEKGKDINTDIKALTTKGLPPRVQKALDICRVVGNNAVHPGELKVEDTPEIALSLFEMVNFIVEDRITRPREIDELYGHLPEDSRKAIEKRDAS
jgi:hypothetical protein